MLLLDSDFIIASRFSLESTHEKAKALAKNYFTGKNVFYLNLVLYEVAAVLSRKYSQKYAIEITKELRKNPECILTLTNEDERKTWELFYSQKRKNVSFVDCANAIVAESYGLKILSFDNFYKKTGVKP